MDVKNFMLACLLVISRTHSISEKTWVVGMFTVGAIITADNLINTLPRFYKHDKHKKLDWESTAMAVRVVFSLWYWHRFLNFSKKAWDKEFVIGRVSDLKLFLPELFK